MNIGACFLLLSSLSSAFAFTSPNLSQKFGIARSTSSALNMVVTKEDLLGARGAIDKILDEKNCGPIFVRLAWHDSGA